MCYQHKGTRDNPNGIEMWYALLLMVRGIGYEKMLLGFGGFRADSVAARFRCRKR